MQQTTQADGIFRCTLWVKMTGELKKKKLDFYVSAITFLFLKFRTQCSR